MQLVDLMATDVLTVSPDTTIADAARRMIARETGAAVVIESDDLVGLISERDLMRAIPDACSPETPVSERMSRQVMTAAPDTSIPEAMAIMIEGRFRHLPVVDGGRVLGMVSMRDLMSWTSLRLRLGPLGDDDEIDSAELLATIHRMRTGAA
ncbi:MAG TPA: CBS domain-containing protein [Gaiella sp.]|jgi:CBS domain-containing protein|nr:CBS domain-containing protein [Gaiella sp.]HEX5029125.1 CBS domain-containing protein [Gaiellaceae bacterium]